jgi:murein DD-endopeptidase MepM/ murein hydrolase activator NlpD
MVTLASHASVAVASSNTGTAGQLIGLVGATHVITGGVISSTTIVALHVELLAQSSVAVHVRVTLYVPAQEPWVVSSA